MANNTYDIDHERYQAWLKAARERGETVTTRTRAFFKDMFDRRKYNGPIPDGVLQGRRLNDSLEKLERDIEQVKKNTTKKIDGWKFLQSIAAKVAGDIDKFSK